MPKLSGLGRGLQSLIPSKPISITPKQKGDTVFYVEIRNIKPNALQPRRDFDPETLKELASSIKKYGILQPLLVQKLEEETEKGISVNYELIAGERRLRAAKLAGLSSVPVIIKDQYDEKRYRLELALVENLQREDLNPIDEAEAYHQLMKDFKLSQSQIGSRVGKSPEAISNSIRLIQLPEHIKGALRGGKISKTHGKALLAFKDPKKQDEMFKQIVAGKADYRDVHQTSKLLHPSADRAARLQLHKVRFQELQDNLTSHFKTAVFIKIGNKGGKIEIKFSDLEELNSLARGILG